jgi:hypothetical protein
MAGICCSIASRSQRLSGAHERVVDGDRSSARGNLHSTATPQGEPALDQRPRADILAVEIQKIEQGEDQRRGNAARMRKGCANKEEIRFATDSPLERAGFKPSVPGESGFDFAREVRGRLFAGARGFELSVPLANHSAPAHKFLPASFGKCCGERYQRNRGGCTQAEEGRRVSDVIDRDARGETAERCTDALNGRDHAEREIVTAGAAHQVCCDERRERGFGRAHDATRCMHRLAPTEPDMSAAG